MAVLVGKCSMNIEAPLIKPPRLVNITPTERHVTQLVESCGDVALVAKPSADF